MDTTHYLRGYHLALAVSAIAAYTTGEIGPFHSYIGYAVAAAIVLRLLLSLSKDKQLGFARFKPSFKNLKKANLSTHPAVSRVIILVLAISLIGATATGIAMDKGRSLGIGITSVSPDPNSNQTENSHNERMRKRIRNHSLKEAHEFFANIFILFALLHIAYLLKFRLPLAKYMLFLPQKNDRGPVNR